MKKRFVLCLLVVLIPALVGCGLVRRTEAPLPSVSAAPAAVPETVPATIPETVPETIPETTPETLPPAPVEVIAPTAPATGTLTAANCPDFSAVLSAQHTDNDRFRDFARQYDDRIVEFDGCITSIEAHDHDEYLIQVRAGDYNSNGTYSGPIFVLEIDDDDPWHHGQSTSFSLGQNVTIRAEVDDFNTYSRLFELDPVSITLR